jgi:hypothetical protein
MEPKHPSIAPMEIELGGLSTDIPVINIEALYGILQHKAAVLEKIDKAFQPTGSSL